MADAVDTRSLGRPAARSRIWLALGAVMVFVASLLLSTAGGGMALVGGIVALVAGAAVIRRPAIGILIFLTTFLFTYPAFLRGVGNFTINNMLGLTLMPLMFYGMLREGDTWIFKMRPMVLMFLTVILLLTSAAYYRPSAEWQSQREVEKVMTSRRAQGPALVATRDAGTKFLTRVAFLAFFVFFIRSPRDIKSVIVVIVACLLMTYMNVSAEAGPFGWGTGRLRVLGEEGAGVYAGRNPNKLAYFALFVLTLLWYARRGIKSPLLYPVWFVATLIAFIMIPLTGSRSGLLNLLFFVVIVLLEGEFNYRKVIGVALITFVIAIQFGYDASVIDLLVPEEVAGRLTSFEVRTEVLEEGVEASGSAEGRVQTAQAALRIWRYHPFFGVGIGNFNTERAITDPTGTVGPPHNSYLWALSEGGLATFFVFLAIFFWTLRELRRIEWEYEARYGPVELGWLVSCMRTVLIGFLFFSFFADMWYHVMYFIIMGMCLAVIRIHQVYAETGQVPEPFRLGRPVVATPT